MVGKHCLPQHCWRKCCKSPNCSTRLDIWSLTLVNSNVVTLRRFITLFISSWPAIYHFNFLLISIFWGVGVRNLVSYWLIEARAFDLSCCGRAYLLMALPYRSWHGCDVLTIVLHERHYHHYTHHSCSCKHLPFHPDCHEFDGTMSNLQYIETFWYNWSLKRKYTINSKTNEIHLVLLTFPPNLSLIPEVKMQQSVSAFPLRQMSRLHFSRLHSRTRTDNRMQ